MDNRRDSLPSSVTEVAALPDFGDTTIYLCRVCAGPGRPLLDLSVLTGAATTSQVSRVSSHRHHRDAAGGSSETEVVAV
jgi:hypothetical protein